MKESKLKQIKIIVLAVFGTIAAIAGIVITYLFTRTQDDFVDYDKAFKIKPHKKETEVLPQSPELDQTIDDIENDIINDG